jgi:hypothetical protein
MAWVVRYYSLFLTYILLGGHPHIQLAFADTLILVYCHYYCYCCSLVFKVMASFVYCLFFVYVCLCVGGNLTLFI